MSMGDAGDFADLASEAESQREIEQLKRQRDNLARQLHEVKHKRADYLSAVWEAVQESLAGVALRPVKPPRLLKPKGDGPEEVAVALLSDLQTGKITPDYNTDVCRERVMRYAEKIVKIANVQRADHPVRKCVVPALGDFVEGVDIFPGQQWLIDSTLYAQVFRSTPAIFADFLRYLLANFDEVEVHAVDGNHGRIGRKGMFGPEDNADKMVYRVTELMLRDEPRLTWNITDYAGERSWYRIMNIGNYKALLIHGDQIRGSMGFPWYGLCLPAEAEILTREGWKRYGELRPNEHVMTFDSDTHENRWESVEAVNVFDWSGDLMEVNGIPATPGHSWPVETADEGIRKMLTTQEINTNHKVPLHGEYSGDASSALSPRLAALLGWIVTDGHWRHRSTTPEAVIYQSASKSLVEIEALTGMTRRGEHHGVYQVSVKADDIRALSAAGFNGKADLPGIVGLLSREAAEAMMDAMYKAEGNMTGAQRRFVQVGGPVADAYQMLSVMCGSTVTCPADADGMVRMTHRKSNYVYPARDGGMAAVPYEGKVWCPTTPSGTWWVRYRGRIMPTGNSKKVHSWGSGGLGVDSDFQDVMMGHYHSLARVPLNHRSAWANGSTESTNTFAAETLAAQSRPTQWLLFVDPAAGRVTASYGVELA
jgi:hypothetical protein